MKSKVFYQIREKAGESSVCVQTTRSKAVANKMLAARLAAGRNVFIVRCENN